MWVIVSLAFEESRELGLESVWGEQGFTVFQEGNCVLMAGSGPVEGVAHEIQSPRLEG